MVRDEVYRRKKYMAKVTGDAAKLRFDALKETMDEQIQARFAELATLETEIKRDILEPEGVSSIFIPQYLNVARQLYKLVQKFSGETLKNEAHVVLNKWFERGLKPDLLNAIAAKFGIPPKTFPSGGGGT